MECSANTSRVHLYDRVAHRSPSGGSRVAANRTEKGQSRRTAPNLTDTLADGGEAPYSHRANFATGQASRHSPPTPPSGRRSSPDAGRGPSFIRARHKACCAGAALACCHARPRIYSFRTHIGAIPRHPSHENARPGSPRDVK
jgi:hypothetical protein